jgi:DNA repair protein RecO
MYSKTHTRAFVLGHYDIGEGSRIYRLFTRDLGTVFARCQSSREERSRQRFGLQLLSMCEVSLVRAKSGWRMTNVTPDESLFSAHAHDMRTRGLVVRVLSLVRRFVIGEEESSELFSIVEHGMNALSDSVDADTLRALETLLVLRILNTLGYIQNDGTYAPYLRSPFSFSDETLSSFAPVYRSAVGEINRAIEASHL